MKTLFRLLVFLALVALVTLLSGFVQVVISEDGVRLFTKRTWTLKETILNTTQWGPKEYLTHPRVSGLLAKDRMMAFGQKLSKKAEDLSQQFEEWKSNNPQAKDHFNDMQKRMDQMVKDLHKQMEKKEITSDRLEKELERLLEQFKEEWRRLEQNP
jgi:hypothetical protein